MRHWCVGTLGLLLVACLWGGCQKEGEVAKRPGSPPAGGNDALWAFAPADVSVALVAGDGSLARAHDGLVGLVAALEKAPGGGPIAAMVRSKLDVEGLDLFDRAALARMGLDLGRGAAAFIGKHARIAVLPVRDHTNFVAHVKGSTEGGVDRLSDELFCKPIEGRYVCADTREALASAGRSPAAHRWPGDMRGDVEMFVGPEELDLEENDEFRFDGLRGLRFSFLLERGGITARAHFMGKPAGQIAGWRSTPPAVVKGLSQRSPAGVLVLQAGALWHKQRAKILASAGAKPLPGGVTEGELLASWTGELALYTLPHPGFRGGARFGLSDPGPAKKLLGSCNALGSMLPAGVRLKASGDRCVLAADLGALAPAVGAGALSAEVWVEPDAFVVEVGDAGMSPPAAELPAFGREVLTGAWSIAFWGHGALSPPSLPPGWRPYWDQIRAQPYGALSLWWLLHLNELGFAFQVADDGARLFARVRTLWSNPDEVVAEVQNRITAFAGGKVDALDDLESVAARHPHSPFASDLEAGAGFVAFQAGLLAAIAIPAVVKYIEKSRSNDVW